MSFERQLMGAYRGSHRGTADIELRGLRSEIDDGDKPAVPSSQGGKPKPRLEAQTLGTALIGSPSRETLGDT